MERAEAARARAATRDDRFSFGHGEVLGRNDRYLSSNTGNEVTLALAAQHSGPDKA